MPTTKKLIRMFVLSKELDKKLKQEAYKRQQSRSMLVREALHRFFKMKQ